MCFADVPKSYVGMSKCCVEKMMRLADVLATDADGFPTDVPAAIFWCVFGSLHIIWCRCGTARALSCEKSAVRHCGIAASDGGFRMFVLSVPAGDGGRRGSN